MVRQATGWSLLYSFQTLPCLQQGVCESVRAVLQNVMFLPLPFEWNLWPAVRNDQCCPPTCSVLNPWFKTWNGLDLFGQVWTRPTQTESKHGERKHAPNSPPPPSVRPPCVFALTLTVHLQKSSLCCPPAAVVMFTLWYLCTEGVRYISRAEFGFYANCGCVFVLLLKQ